MRRPDNVRAWLFDLLSRTYRKALPRPVRDGLEIIIFGVSPSVPTSLTRSSGPVPTVQLFWGGFIVAFVLCFLVVVAWTVLSGTFSGQEVGKLFFVEDWPNIINYSVLCPLYVGFGSVVIGAVIRSGPKLDRLSKDSRPNPWSRGLVVLLVLLFAALLTAQYMTEILSPDVYPESYWFIGRESSDGDRILGALGIYYILLNFTLLVFALAVAAAFFSIFRSLITLGRFLSRSDDLPFSTDELKEKLQGYTVAYAGGKLFVAVLMLNAYTWKWERPQGSFNLILMGAALTVLGTVYLSFPRYFVENQWFYLRQRAGEEKARYEDIRSFKVKVTASVVDAVIVGGFISTFWGVRLF